MEYKQIEIQSSIEVHKDTLNNWILVNKSLHSAEYGTIEVLKRMEAKGYKMKKNICKLIPIWYIASNSGGIQPKFV